MMKSTFIFCAIIFNATLLISCAHSKAQKPTVPLLTNEADAAGLNRSIPIAPTTTHPAEALSEPTPATPGGEIEVTTGDVLVKSGLTGETKPAQVGQKIAANDTLITGKNAQTKVVMSDKNEFHLSANSKIEIKKYDDDRKGKINVLINLLNGKVRANVRQKYDGKDKVFQIQTRTAVAGVRGTEFTASFDEISQRAQILTFEGSVQFGVREIDGSIKNLVNVTAGESSTAMGSNPPSAPETVDTEKLKELDKESTVVAPVVAQTVPPQIPVSQLSQALAPANSAVDANVALGWLRNGNKRFIEHQLRADGQSKKDIQRLATEQHPHSIILTCSDSRVPPEIIFDQKLGEIFVIRTLDAAPNKSVVASIEAAFVNFHTRLLLVLGHSNCTNPQAISDKLKIISATLRSAAEKGEIVIQPADYDLNTGVVDFK